MLLCHRFICLFSTLWTACFRPRHFHTRSLFVLLNCWMITTIIIFPKIIGSPPQMDLVTKWVRWYSSLSSSNHRSIQTSYSFILLLWHRGIMRVWYPFAYLFAWHYYVTAFFAMVVYWKSSICCVSTYRSRMSWVLESLCLYFLLNRLGRSLVILFHFEQVFLPWGLRGRSLWIWNYACHFSVLSFYLRFDSLTVHSIVYFAVIVWRSQFLDFLN